MQDMDAKQSVWFVSFKDLGELGYSYAYVEAENRGEAIYKARQEIHKFNPKAKLILQIYHEYTPEEEEDYLLDQLYSKFRSAYLHAWMPNIRGCELIEKAKQELSKDDWSYVWIR